MLNILTKTQRRKIYLSLLANLYSDSFTASFFEINEEKVRICYNAVYSDMRVVSLDMLPELQYFEPNWNTDHKVTRLTNWFKGMDENLLDENHTELKKIIIEFCLVLINEVEEENKLFFNKYCKKTNISLSVRDIAGVLSERKIKVKARPNAKKTK